MARYVTFNTDTGGIDPDGSEHRRLAQIEIISSLDPLPSVLGLQELTGWHRQDWRRLYELANAVGMAVLPPVTSNAGNGENHMALLYRPGEVTVLSYDKVHDGNRLHHGLGRAHVIIDGTRVMILFTHMCPFDPTVRLQEAKFITDYAGSFPGRPDNAVLLGDFNTADRGPTAEAPSLGPEPDWDRDVPRNLQPRYRRILGGAGPGGLFGDTDRDALDVLVAAGWIDPQDLLSDFPRAATVGHRYDNEPTPQRLDHILYAGRQITPTGYTTISDETTKAASDHLPVCLDTA
ncbi:endonuclease/exonuclease/phosphatase family protein [Streptomyces sp. NPDC045470]|uniref:endonuclease/exonuclease/phosphatase family protein n=1 Tax=Streptomyces sp. NPDC045470 TaxID=3155469 RepID=UPI00340729C8